MSVKKKIGSILVGEKIGSGGFGNIYSGIDTALNRKVAIKIIDSTFYKDEQMKTFLTTLLFLLIFFACQNDNSSVTEPSIQNPSSNTTNALATKLISAMETSRNRTFHNCTCDKLYYILPTKI